MREYQRFTNHLIHRYAIIPVSTADFVAAADLTQRHPLKAYDAIQLAVALRYAQILSGHPFTFVSGDSTLLAAAQTAQAEGLVTENPFDHAIPDESPGRSG